MIQKVARLGHGQLVQRDSVPPVPVEDAVEDLALAALARLELLVCFDDLLLGSRGRIGRVFVIFVGCLSQVRLAVFAVLLVEPFWNKLEKRLAAKARQGLGDVGTCGGQALGMRQSRIGGHGEGLARHGVLGLVVLSAQRRGRSR